MFSEFIVPCHVSTIPKSPPKMIRDKKNCTDSKSQFFLPAFNLVTIYQIYLPSTLTNLLLL